MQSDKCTSHTRLLLWFARVEALTTDGEKQIKNLLSPSERQRLQRTTSIKKQKEYLQSRILMRYALTQTFGPDEAEWCFTECPNGPPVISSLPDGIFYSVSHSDGLICFAIANCAVGVDLECIRPRKNLRELADAFMSSDELPLLESCHAQTIFYRIWSAKEAYFKALPAQEQAGFIFSDFSLPVQLSAKGGQYYFYTSNIDQHVLSVVTGYSLKSIHSYPQSMGVMLAEGIPLS